MKEGIGESANHPDRHETLKEGIVRIHQQHSFLERTSRQRMRQELLQGAAHEIRPQWIVHGNLKPGYNRKTEVLFEVEGALNSEKKNQDSRSYGPERSA